MTDDQPPMCGYCDKHPAVSMQLATGTKEGNAVLHQLPGQGGFAVKPICELCAHKGLHKYSQAREVAAGRAQPQRTVPGRYLDEAQ